MKKIIVAFTLTILTLTCPITADAQNMYYNGKNVTLKFPRGIEASREYSFPTFKSRTGIVASDTIAVSVTDLETYVTTTGISTNPLVNITRNSYVYAGAKLFLKLSSNAPDTIRTVIVKDGTTTVDTFYVGRIAYREYVFNGSSFQKVNSEGLPEYIGTVTQATSISTGVTLNSDAGVITTVSSTLAADDSSASFTLTNSFIKATSTIILTTGTAGNGRPEATVTSQTNGSAVIKLWNGHRLAALNNTVKIHFLILNK